MPANLENSAVATEQKKVHFHSNPKERQCQKMFKLLHSCTHLICQQNNALNSPSQASIVHELRISRCSSWTQERQRHQRSNCQHPLDHRKSREFRKTSTLLTMPKPLTVWKGHSHNKMWKILQEMGVPDPLTCFLRNLCTVQEATVTTEHGTTEWFQIEKGVCQDCILSPCLYNFYAEYIM